jgi:3-phenylpropionate/cinnamic acid dioxygenase small subunit
MESRAQLENLLARYCRAYDDGDLDTYADLFSGSTISGMSTHDEIVAFHRDNIYWYDGVPRTRHVISNIELDIDEVAGTASGRCYVIVYQEAPQFPLQPILIGSYVDRFERAQDEWRFADRHFEPHLVGDISRHAHPGAKLPDSEPLSMPS